MSDSLNEHQTEVLANYQSLTGEEDMERSIQTLRNSNWDLQRAVSGGGSSRQPSIPPAVAYNGRVQRRVPAGRGGLFWPISLVYRIVTAPISFSYSIVTGMWRIGTSFLGSMIPYYGGAQRAAVELDPATETARFVQFIESRYGNHHPNFVNGTYVQAVERARSECKLLFIYLHCELNDNAANFCRNTLCTEVLQEFINDNFIAWASNIKYPQGFQVNNILGATSYPYMAILCCNPVGSMRELSSSNVGVVDRIEGMISTDDLMARLFHALDGFGHLLTGARQERERREIDRRLRQEQDDAYRRSLAEDEEKERKAREEQERAEREERERAEREAKEEQERLEREEAKKRAREIRRNNLPPEPTEKNAVLIVVKLPDGKQVRRKFLPTNHLQTILDFVDLSQSEEEIMYDYADDFVLVANFPRKVFSEPTQTLQEAGLTVASTLFVESKS